MTSTATKAFFKSAIMGAPGSGKGTISSRIVKKFNIVHLSMGDILRQNIAEKNELGLTAEKYISEGVLVPDEIVDAVLLNKLKDLNSTHWLLDGYPRTVSQAEKLFASYPLHLVINLDVPYEVIIERIKNRFVHVPSGRVYSLDFNPPKVEGKDDVTGEPLTRRPDDHVELVKERLNVYAANTLPLVEYFKKHGVLKEFKGKTSDEIWPEVEKELLKYIQPKS